MGPGLPTGHRRPAKDRAPSERLFVQVGPRVRIRLAPARSQDQIIIAEVGAQTSTGLPPISYHSGGLEEASTRKAVCSILEGGEKAFLGSTRRSCPSVRSSTRRTRAASARGQVRTRLAAGGRWIRTFGSARYLMAVRGRLLEAYSRSFSRIWICRIWICQGITMFAPATLTREGFTAIWLRRPIVGQPTSPTRCSVLEWERRPCAPWPWSPRSCMGPHTASRTRLDFLSLTVASIGTRFPCRFASTTRRYAWSMDTPIPWETYRGKKACCNHWVDRGAARYGPLKPGGGPTG
jgi:hypothetical protein